MPAHENSFAGRMPRTLVHFFNFGAAWANATSSSLSQYPTSVSYSTIAATGTGSAYAAACQEARSSFTSAQSSWISRYGTVQTAVVRTGGPTVTMESYWPNATTLCDGHPRLSETRWATPTASSLITKNPGATPTIVSTEYGTVFPNIPWPYPSCSIAPNDCDPLWTSYSSLSSAYSSRNAVSPQITPAPQTPPCMNASAASTYSSQMDDMNGCGACTLFGDGVQLVFFDVPTTVTRDMCASTPTASPTYFLINDGALDVYAGTSYGSSPAPPGAVTAVDGRHTFTSGTAYISISKVYAKDRCSKQYGSTVRDAIIALKSESVLSLRYSQNHFQYFFSSTSQTGYPINYADFREPVPWSAWNGQARCIGPNWGNSCDLIKTGGYRPQLAIPAAIRQLDPAFASCQNWYGGLYDPPLVMTTASAFDTPKVYTTVAQEPVRTSEAAPAPTPDSPPQPTGTPPDSTGYSGSPGYVPGVGVAVPSDRAHQTAADGGPRATPTAAPGDGNTAGSVTNPTVQGSAGSGAAGNAANPAHDGSSGSGSSNGKSGGSGSGSDNGAIGSGSGSGSGSGAGSDRDNSGSNGGDDSGRGSGNEAAQPDSRASATPALRAVSTVFTQPFQPSQTGSLTTLITISGQIYTVTDQRSQSGQDFLVIGTATLSNVGATATIAPGVTVSRASNGIVLVQTATASNPATTGGLSSIVTFTGRASSSSGSDAMSTTTSAADSSAGMPGWLMPMLGSIWVMAWCMGM